MGQHLAACYRFLYLIKCPRERGLALGLWPLCAFGAGAKPRAAQRVRARVENGKHADGPVGSETLGSHHGASLEDHGPNVVLYGQVHRLPDSPEA